MSTSGPRTLAEQLRGWPDDRLAALLEQRPDLAVPVPQNSAQLASRAVTRASVLRSLDALSVLELAVLEVVAAADGSIPTALVHRQVNAAPEAVDRSLELLRSRALVWGAADEQRPVSVLRELLGTTVSRLGPSAAALLAGYGPKRLTELAHDLGLEPTGDRQRDIAAVAALLADEKTLTDLLAELDDRARTLLEHLDAGGPVGTVETTERWVRRGDAAEPVDQLLARGLLVARDHRHVVVPREVGIGLRGGRTTREAVDRPPPLATSAREPAALDRAAAGAAFELVRRVGQLLDHWGSAPPPVLRAGGLGVRDLKAAASLLHLDERAAALHVEVAAAAGLLAVGDTSEDTAWLPTDAYDVWSVADPAERWLRLVRAWLDSPRLFGLVGGRVNGRPVNPLVDDLERGAWVLETRHVVLETLAALPAGDVLAPGTGLPSLVAGLAWSRPRRPAPRDEAVGWAVEEATVLGVVALGGLSTQGRTLLEDPARAVDALRPLLPEPVDRILLQADLTAVAPGPLETELARRLAVVADVESRGGATVFRFTADSVRRAFDAGWSAADVHEFIASASRTPVPQPLVYLVDDVARRFGTLRIGAAESFLRSEDEAALAELVHHPKAGALGLHRIAPTVVVSDQPVDVLLERLRELGAAPVLETGGGTLRLPPRRLLRARTPRARAPDARELVRARARAAAAVTGIRAGDRAAASRPATGEAERTTSGVLAALTEAAGSKRPVWVRYVDNHGGAVERVLQVRRVDAGRLSAYDERTDSDLGLALHRVTAVRLLPR